MELRTLFQVVISRWWLVLPVFALTLAGTIAFTVTQKPLYSASATLVVAPSDAVQGDILSALAIISRQSEIGDTYAQIGASRTVQDQAAQELGLSAEDRGRIDLESVLVTGTTLLQITATSPDPGLSAAYANAVSEALVDHPYNSIFSVEILDQATEPRRPVSPDVPLNLGLGIIGGLLLGVGLAVISHIIQPPARAGLRDIVDPETWAFNDGYFAYRLAQEMNRSVRSRQTTAVALIDVNHENALDDLMPRARTEAMRRIATMLDSHVRPEDIVARLYGSVFGVLMPDTNEEQAVAMVDGLRSRIAAPAFGTTANGAPAHANPAAGVVEYREGVADVMDHAQSALRAAKEGPIGRTEAFSALAVQPGT
ncbi:MAG TPA: diguanylate cyclase [Candidatus Limnocylindria bacterium]|nr:diguanylate cyclase [Candidatus Limnocylindria bacterium]